MVGNCLSKIIRHARASFSQILVKHILKISLIYVDIIVYIYTHIYILIYIYILLYLDILFNHMFICYAFPDPSPAPDHSTSERSGSCLGNRDGEEGSQGPAVVVHGESLCCFECFVRVIYLGVTLGVKHGKTIHWNVSRSSRLGCASAKDANDLNVISGSPTPSVAMSRSSTAVHQTATSNAWLLRSFPKETLERRCLTHEIWQSDWRMSALLK